MSDKPPADIADHAEDFSRRYAEPLDDLVSQRMLDLNIPPEQIGSGNHEYGVQHAAFMPHERTGGGNVPGRKITVDSGVFNPALNAAEIGPAAHQLWAGSRLRDRIDAAIAHEYEEAARGTHDHAIEAAPETALPIGDHARRILRAIRDNQRAG